MSGPPFLTAPLLEAPHIAHGFFGREGGVSEGVFASLNTGPGSNDRPEHVKENRRRCAVALGVAPDRLLTNTQIHSADIAVVDGPWAGSPREADGLVTATPGLALGVLSADCMPWLFVDTESQVIGAAHAGWRGALAGIVENTVEAMVRLGARKPRIRAALGPCLRQSNFEVGLELLDAFTEKHPEAERFFAPGESADKRLLDLAGFAVWRLLDVGVTQIDDVHRCTLQRPETYFSYRASRRRGETDYGRNLSAVALA